MKDERPVRLVPNLEDPEYFTEWRPPTELDSCGPDDHEYVDIQECRRCGSLLHPEVGA